MEELREGIRPPTTTDTAKTLVENLYGLRVKCVKELESYDGRNYHVKVSEDYDNSHIQILWPHGYILKIQNSADTHKQHAVGEHAVQKLLDGVGIKCQQPVLNLKGEDMSREALPIGYENQTDGPSSVHIVRLLTYQEGQLLKSVPYSSTLMHDVGLNLAKIHTALEGWSHPTLMNYETMWNLGSVPKLRDYVHAVKNEDDKSLLLQVVKAFEKEVVPVYPKLTKGIIHGDYNEANILVKLHPDQQNVPNPDQTYEISGVLDFANTKESYIVFDVAIAIMSVMLDSKLITPLKVGGHVLAGYLSERKLNDTDFDSLRTLVASTFCHVLTLATYTYLQNPDNEYTLETSKRGWEELKELCRCDKEELYLEWKKIIESYR